MSYWLALPAIRQSPAVQLQSQPAVPAQPAPYVPAAESAPSFRVPTNLPQFRCGKEPFRDPEHFLVKFETVLSVHGLDPEQHWLRLLPGCLNHLDITWAQQTFDASFTWQEAKHM